MKKLLILILFVLSLSLFTSSVKAVVCDVTATTGYWQDIQNAVDQVATTGGNVCIPEGEWNFVNVGEAWSDARVTIPAGVNIFGAPTERDVNDQVKDVDDDGEPDWKTVLIMPWDVPGSWLGEGYSDPPPKGNAPKVPVWFSITASTVDPSRTSRFSDIKLVGYRSIDPESDMVHRGLSIGNIQNFRVDHSCFEHTAGGGIGVWGIHASGVIDHTRLYNLYGMDNYAYYYLGNIGYGISVGRAFNSIGYVNYEPKENLLGKYTDHSVYIEDCYLSRWRHCTSSGHGAHYVLRYSIIEKDCGHSSVDAHGLRDCRSEYYDTETRICTDPEVWGTRACEFYENVFRDVILSENRHINAIGSGSGVWFNNNIDDSYTDMNIHPDDWILGPSGDLWHVKDYYFWSNIGAWDAELYEPSGIPSGFTADRNTLIDWSRDAGSPGDSNYPNVDPSWSIAGYQPYTYPHPLILEETPTTSTTTLTTTTVISTTTIPSGQVAVSGELSNSSGIVEALVTLFNTGTSRINQSESTTNGVYSMNIWPDTYDLQYNILDIPNFFIKLISLIVSSDLQDVVNYVNKYENNVSFKVDISADQEIQVYSSQEPISVKANGIELIEGTLPLQLDEWYFDSGNNILHIKVSLTSTTTSTTTIPVTTTTVTTTSTTSTLMTTTTSTTTTITGTEKTFGNTIVGNLDWWTGGNTIQCCRFNLPEDGIVSKITIHMYSGTNHNHKCAIYDSSGNLQRVTEELYFSTGWDWKEFSFLSSISLSTGDYYLCYWGNLGTTLKRSSGSLNQAFSNPISYNGFPESITKENEYNYNVSIYATYTT